MKGPEPDETKASTTHIDAEFDARMELVMQAVDKYHNYLLQYLIGYTRNHHDAEDLLQTLWKHVLLHFPQEKIGKIGLLRRKAYQIFVDAYRFRKRRAEQLTPDYTGIEPESRAYEPGSDAEEAALKEQFWDEFQGINLTDTQRECIWLHARYGYSYSEIGQKLGIGKSTVGDAVTNARHEIKQMMEQEKRR